MVTPEEMEATRTKAEDEATMKVAKDKRKTVVQATSMLIMQGDMRSILNDLLATGMIGSRADAGSSELTLELMPNDVKLEGRRNYLSWSKRAQLILRTKGAEHYLQEPYVEPVDKASMDWMVEAMQGAVEIWKTLSNMYFGACNVMMVKVQSKVKALI